MSPFLTESWCFTHSACFFRNYNSCDHTRIVHVCRAYATLRIADRLYDATAALPDHPGSPTAATACPVRHYPSWSSSGAVTAASARSTHARVGDKKRRPILAVVPLTDCTTPPRLPPAILGRPQLPHSVPCAPLSELEQQWSRHSRLSPLNARARGR